MLRITIALLLTLCSGAVYADVLDHEYSLVVQLVHQTLGAHHLPYTLIAIIAAAIAYRSWRIAKK